MKSEVVRGDEREFAELGFEADALSHIRYKVALARGLRDSALVKQEEL